MLILQVTLKTDNLDGTVKFIGELSGKYGIWYGIELDKRRGTSDGSIKKIKYFKTKKNRGLFVKKHEISKTTQSNKDVPRCSVGDIVRINKFNCNGIVRYIGSTDFKNGTWYGIELKKPKGKNNGTVNNRSYFVCKQKYGTFVKGKSISTKNEDKPQQQKAKQQVLDLDVTIGDTVKIFIIFLYVQYVLFHIHKIMIMTEYIFRFS